MRQIKAFSLLEMSIAMIIIGTLVVGVFRGVSFVNKATIFQARTTTLSSPVTAIKNLVFWIEPTLEASFSGVDLSSDFPKIHRWKDINPVSTGQYDLEVSTTAPTYYVNAIGGLPSVFFDYLGGSFGDSLKTRQFEPTRGASELSMFVVTKAQENTSSFGTIVSGGNTSGVSGYFLRKGANGDESWEARFGTGTGWRTLNTLEAVTFDDPTILRYSYKDGVHYLSKNGGMPVTLVKNYQPNQADDDSSLIIGASIGAFYYDGFISEIIIYDRGLDKDEMNEIELYLSHKYKIDLKR